MVGHIRRIGGGDVSVVVVEQNASVALDVADDVYVLEAGRIVDHGPPDSLRGGDKLSAHYFGGGADGASVGGSSGDHTP
jgi:ABC-type branched-subunit amino acid transport system ATPase component